MSRPWTVDLRANGDLANRVAPCVIHTLDGYFNALVLAYLGWESSTTSWPFTIAGSSRRSTSTSIDPGGCLGSELLGRALEAASRDWLCAKTSLSPGIGVVYEWFVSALTGPPYEDLATNARDRWRQRVDDWRRWPKFTAS